MQILIAEDDQIARMLLQNTLKKRGYEVLCAENGRQAWELANKYTVNLLISDLDMPEMDGFDLCRKIRASSRDDYIYIIMLTALDDKSNLLRVFDSGADDYIPKPFDLEELEARIHTGVRVIALERGHKDLQRVIGSSRDKLRVILDSMNEEIVSVDRNLSIASVNKAFVRRQEVSFQDVIGQTITNIDSVFDDPSSWVQMVENIKSVFKTGEEKSENAVSGDAENERQYKELTFLPVKDSQNEVSQVVIVSRDVTEQRRKTMEIYDLNRNLRDALNQVNIKKQELEEAMAQLKLTQAQALQTEKMASIGQLAAGVAHEINNPTGFVSSNLNTLDEYLEDIDSLLKAYRELLTGLNKDVAKKNLSSGIPAKIDLILNLEQEIDIEFVQEDIRDLIKDCREGTDRIKKIVLNLKRFAHPGEDKLVTRDISQGLESTLNMVNNELKYKATVTMDLGDLPEIQCYPQQLNQVFMNILVNAAQAIETHGEIKIMAEHVNGNVEIRISDTGSGISEENIPRIFDPFFTTKDVGKGTGLGMNIAYNIIKKHNGTIDVESTVGKGTTFTIKLPAGRIDDLKSGASNRT